MNIRHPPLHSVWENDDGDKLFVAKLSKLPRAAACVRAFFLVTYAEYVDGHNIGCEIDNDQWSDLIASEGFRMTGIVPIDS